MTTPTTTFATDPEFADDYVAHQPSQYSVSRAVTATGDVIYLLTFIDTILVPVIVGEKHSAREKRLIRTSVQLPKNFFEHMVKTIEGLEPKAEVAMAQGTVGDRKDATQG